MQYESILTNDEIRRYSRQIILKEIKPEGQVKIRNAKVLVIGLGGLGSPVATYLAGSGIGTLGILDYDTIEMHNLQRQTMHTEKYVEKKKTESAVNFIKAFNSSININVHDDFLDEENIQKIIHNYDIILDCTDDIKTRYVINDMVRICKKKFIAASVLTWEGQVFVFSEDGPCYRCLFPEMQKRVVNCDEAGVVSPACGVIGSIQAIETIKMILGLSKPGLITYNTLISDLSFFNLEKKSKCEVCSNKKLVDKKMTDNKPPKMEKIDSKYKITWEEYLKNKNKHTLIDIRDTISYEICHVKGSINIPSEMIEADKNVVTKYKNLIIVCKKGISAKRIGNILINAGIECLVMEGGLRKFKSDIDQTFPLD